MPRWSRSGGVPSGRSRSAESAGDKVSELNALMAVLIAIVSANWL